MGSLHWQGGVERPVWLASYAPDAPVWVLGKQAGDGAALNPGGTGDDNQLGRHVENSREFDKDG